MARNKRKALASFAPVRLLLIRPAVVFVVEFLCRLDFWLSGPGIEPDSLVVVAIQVKYIRAIFKCTFRQVFPSDPF